MQMHWTEPLMVEENDNFLGNWMPHCGLGLIDAARPQAVLLLPNIAAVNMM